MTLTTDRNQKRESWGNKPYRKDMNFDKCKQSEWGDEHGSPQEIANAVHFYLDWLRACEKRTWDNRPQPSAIHMLKTCQRGRPINYTTELHYDEDKDRH